MKYFLLISLFLFSVSSHGEVVTITAVAKVVVTAAQAYKENRDADKTLETILAAIRNSTAAIQQSLENIQVGNVESCSDAITIDFENFLNYRRDTQEAFARDYLRCVTEAGRVMDQVSHSGVDRVGKAFNILAGISLFVHEYLNFSQSALLSAAKKGNRKIKQKLKPACSMRTIEPGTPERIMTCSSYNRDFARGHVVLTRSGHIAPAGEKERLEDEAANNTSYIIAKEFLNIWENTTNNTTWKYKPRNNNSTTRSIQN